MRLMRWKRLAGVPNVQAPLSVAEDYVISHRTDQHTVSYRPTGHHVHVGTFETETAARRAAEAHATLSPQDRLKGDVDFSKPAWTPPPARQPSRRPPPAKPAPRKAAVGVRAAVSGRGMSDLLQGMAAEAKKEGTTFGVRDAREALRDWFAGGKEVAGRVQVAARNYLMSEAGRKTLARVTKKVAEAIQKSQGRVGYRDIGAAILSALTE